MNSENNIFIPLIGNNTKKNIYDFLLNKNTNYFTINSNNNLINNEINNETNTEEKNESNNEKNISSNKLLRNRINCKKPNSKSKQVINVCKTKTYKGPLKNAIKKLNIKKDMKIIDVDSDTMNLFTQKIINILFQQNKIKKNLKIEHFLRIINNNNNHANYLMEGNTYSIKYTLNNKTLKIFNLTEYIDKIINKMDNSNTILFKNNIKLFIKWIKDIFQSLDELYKTIRFHHCDPKADQLFLLGDLKKENIEKNNFNVNTNKIILGDLDKVTFSVKLNNICYRVLTSSNLKYLKKFNFIGFSSTAEKMRSEKIYRSNNLFEKACFLVSILLLIDNDKFRTELEQKLFKEDNKGLISTIFQSLNNKKFLQNKKLNFKDRRSHKKASECIDEESLYNNGKKFISNSDECSIIHFLTKNSSNSE